MVLKLMELKRQTEEKFALLAMKSNDEQNHPSRRYFSPNCENFRLPLAK